MVHLLSVRAAIDMCHQWVILETEVSHHQNEINISEAIREVKAQYATTIGDAKAAYRTAMRKVEAVCSGSTSKPEVIWVTRIRAKATNAMHAFKLQWQHQEAMHNLEDEALEVEKHAHQSFLWTCGVALQACPNEALAKVMYPLNLLMGSPSLPSPLMATSPWLQGQRIMLLAPLPQQTHVHSALSQG